MYQQLIEAIVACTLMAMLTATSVNETKRLINLYQIIHSQELEASACIQAKTLLKTGNKKLNTYTQSIKLAPPLVPLPVSIDCSEIGNSNSMQYQQCLCKPNTKDKTTKPWLFNIFHTES